jgi:hypothetical protein
MRIAKYLTLLLQHLLLQHRLQCQLLFCSKSGRDHCSCSSHLYVRVPLTCMSWCLDSNQQANPSAAAVVSYPWNKRPVFHTWHCRCARSSVLTVWTGVQIAFKFPWAGFMCRSHSYCHIFWPLQSMLGKSLLLQVTVEVGFSTWKVNLIVSVLCVCVCARVCVCVCWFPRACKMYFVF